MGKDQGEKEMMEMGQVISRLNEAAEYFGECRRNASFGSKAEEHFWELQSAMREAAERLKAQEPRVMTLEEMKTWIKTDTLERDPIYFEKRGLAYGEWIDPFEDFDGADIVGYGSDVRCWTSRPTDEQREAVKWNGE